MPSLILYINQQAKDHETLCRNVDRNMPMIGTRSDIQDGQYSVFWSGLTTEEIQTIINSLALPRLKALKGYGVYYEPTFIMKKDGIAIIYGDEYG